MKVIEKQRNSKMCAICGMDNAYGLRAPFYSMEDGSTISLFSYREEHQSYPGRVHGGLICAMLDEIGLRALWSKEGKEIWGVTLNLETKYRKPVPYGVPLLARGEIKKETQLFVTAECGIYQNGELLASATIKYLKLSTDAIANGAPIDEHEEMCYFIEDGVREIPFGGDECTR